MEPKKPNTPQSNAVIFDISSISASPYKTGIPNYVYHLGKALHGQKLSVLGSIDEAVLEDEQTLRYLDESWGRLNADRTPRSPFEKIVRAVRAGAVIERTRNKLIVKVRRVLNGSTRFRNHEKTQHALRTQKRIDSWKPRIQHMTSNTVFRRFSIPLVFTIYDLSPLVCPELQDENNVNVFQKTATDLKALVRSGQPLRFAAISEFTRQEIYRVFGAEFGDLTCVTPLGFDRSLFFPNPAPKPRNDAPYVLSVGTLEPRKNLAVLLTAFETLAATEPELRLKLVGARGWKGESLEQRLNAQPHRDRIDVCGYVNDFELADLYRGCAVFCYPSLYEGFGLPILEAMACGAPVVAAESSSLPEVLGSAGKTFDPLNPSALVEALKEALQNSSALSKKSLLRAEVFSWERCAEATQQIYNKFG